MCVLGWLQFTTFLELNKAMEMIQRFNFLIGIIA